MIMLIHHNDLQLPRKHKQKDLQKNDDERLTNANRLDRSGEDLRGQLRRS